MWLVCNNTSCSVVNKIRLDAKYKYKGAPIKVGYEKIWSKNWVTWTGDLDECIGYAYLEYYRLFRFWNIRT